MAILKVVVEYFVKEDLMLGRLLVVLMLQNWNLSDLNWSIRKENWKENGNAS